MFAISKESVARYRDRFTMSKYLYGVVLCIFIVGIGVGVHSYGIGGRVSAATIVSIRQQCEHTHTNKEAVSCLRRHFRAIVRATNVHEVMDAILSEAYQKTDSDTVYNSPDCHELAHIVGETASAKTNNVSQLFSQCGSACVYGCVHGIFIGLLHQGKVNPVNIADLCRDDRGEFSTDDDHEACIHGVGHGLADYLHNRLSIAITSCDAFEMLHDREECWGGVFMEAFAPVVAQNSTSAVSDDTFLPCRQFQKPIQVMCMASVLEAQHSAVIDIDRAMGICQKPLDQFHTCLDDIETYDTIDIVTEKTIARSCTLAETAMYVCIDKALGNLSMVKDSKAEANRVCSANGVVHKTECRAYVKKQLETRSLR